MAEIAMTPVERKLPPKRMKEPLVDCFAISMSEKRWAPLDLAGLGLRIKERERRRYGVRLG
jgi:hypothetical protein